MSDQDFYAPPAFQFYPTDFISDAPVMAMTLEERGAYITLLCIAWTENGIPADHTKLARVLHLSTARFKRVWSAVEGCWESDGNGRLISPRMEKVRAEAKAKSNAASQAGKAGAKARWS
jgi:uncharacterized protein YdaU (DUF1376 family)